jgi:dTDP-4-dehydrorhamnose 3,5-epimerase
MQALPTDLPGVLLLQPRVFADERGFFMESWSQAAFDAAAGAPVRFVQDNHSMSRRGVLRGLHYQLPPHAQGKLVRVVRGAAFDVAVDIRKGSPTFGRWAGVVLDALEHRQLWIPAGFAHGFLALEDDTHFLYKTTDRYARECERAVAWNDPAIGIAWPDLGAPPLVAPRDAAAPPLAEAETF